MACTHAFNAWLQGDTMMDALHKARCSTTPLLNLHTGQGGNYTRQICISSQLAQQARRHDYAQGCITWLSKASHQNSSTFPYALPMHIVLTLSKSDMLTKHGVVHYTGA